MSKHHLKAEHLVAGYEKKTILQDVSIEIPDEKISVIIGANASGKSTLLKTLVRLIKPSSGEIMLDNTSVDKIPSKEFAKKVGLLPQSPIAPEGITVTDLIGRGRFPHQTFLKSWGEEDTKAVAEAMDIMGISQFANRSIDELSGGQRQRVWIAMALAQQTDILFLDEPTTFLDIAYQVEILDLLTELNRKHKTTIVMVLHEINLSARYADHLFVMCDGKLVSQGEPRKIVTKELIKDVFSLDCTIVEDPVSKSPLLIPIGRYHIEANKETV